MAMDSASTHDGNANEARDDERFFIEEPAPSGSGGRGPWERLREAARNALSQRMRMETADLAHRISRIHDHSDMTQ
mgnify:CR=1 FL=1